MAVRYSTRAAQWHRRRHRRGAVEDCWLCGRAQAICRVKKRMPDRVSADAETAQFNEEHLFEATVIPYWCVWCETYHMKSPKSAAERRHAELLRRRWLLETYRLAEEFWDGHQGPGLASDGVPPDALAWMRTRYVAAVLNNPRAVQELRRGSSVEASAYTEAAEVGKP